MVGLNFVCGDSLSTAPFEAAAKDCAETVHRYESSVIFTNEDFTIFDISYDEYPLKKIEIDSFVVLIEGHIYNVDDYSACAKYIDKQINNQNIRSVTEWLGDQDGDFNIYHVSKEKNILTIISDALNRIPIFYSTFDDKSIIGGRSIHFVKKAMENMGKKLSLNREAIAQTLLLRHPFGRETLYNEISKTGPGAFLEINGGQLIYSQIYNIRFDKRRHKDRTLKQNASELADILLKTCKYRRQLDGQHVVSLSGGKDSRLIATALAETGYDVTAASFYNQSGWTKKDVDVAKKIVEKLEMDWNLYHTAVTGHNMKKLLYRKGGMNNFALGHLVEFYQKLCDDRKVQMYTGDVGDLLDGGWSVYRSFDSITDAANWIIDNNAEISPSQVSKLTGISEEKLITFVAKRLEKFPETELRAKVEHFFARERGMNLDFHGEDRTRTFCWTHAPLNSRPVLEYLIELPREQKKDYKLYKSLMNQIRGGLYDVDYVPYGAPVGSREQLLKQKLYNLISNVPNLRNFVLGFLFDKSGYPKPVSELLAAQIDQSNELEKYLDSDELRAIAARTDTINFNTAFDLITIITLIEYVHGNELTIDSYQNVKFL